jgi:hypothetical protein
VLENVLYFSSAFVSLCLVSGVEAAPEHFQELGKLKADEPSTSSAFFMSSQIHVPRIVEITGKPSAEELRAAREFRRMREQFKNATAKYGYGTPEGKRDWKRRISKTRSF